MTVLSRFFLDLGVWALCTPAALWLSASLDHLNGRALIVFGITLVLIKVAAELVGGLHRRVWHRTGFHEALRTAVVVMVAELGWVTAPVAFQLPVIVAVRGFTVELLMAWSLLLGMRVARRLQVSGALLGALRSDPSEVRAARVLVVGAGEAGMLVAQEMLRHPGLGYVPVGFADDDRRKIGSVIAGLPVLGSVDEIGALCATYDVDEVVAAIPSQNGVFVRRVRELLDGADVSVRFKTMPGLYELLSGDVSISRLREVRTEDLLRRDPVSLDEVRVAGYLRGKRVLITGAGGSIGSELARQVAKHGPSTLLLLGRGENSIFNISRELARRHPDLKQVRIIADVRNRDRLFELFRRHRPAVVFHAAAHKHVSLMEENPEDAVLNNVMGTRNVADAALEFGVGRFVNISTDKAIRPTSVMGATKRVAETLVRDIGSRSAEGQAFVSVRFGNVLGSRGSVVPLFLEQIRNGGPVRVTHQDMRRYFMTIPEASSLVLQAGATAENGAVYVLDMGDPVRIVDLAEDLIRLSGLEPNVDIAIEFTGAKPGEKMFEELVTEEERQRVTSHEKIVMAKTMPWSTDDVTALLDDLVGAASAGDELRVREVLRGRIEGSAVASGGLR